MLLADKIIEQRKKKGWSQEELANRLNVSRQAVSKWEGDQAIPDLDKIVKMASLFNVTTDYLLKEELVSVQEQIDVITEEIPKRKVSLAEADSYLELRKKRARITALATTLCILAPASLIYLLALSTRNSNISQLVAVVIGLVVLLLLVAVAVALFMWIDYREKTFKFLREETFILESGAKEVILEKQAKTDARYAIYIIAGTIICILSVIPLFLLLITEDEFLIIVAVILLLALVSIGVTFIIVATLNLAAFKILLGTTKDELKRKKEEETMEMVSTIYWVLAIAIYLAISFIFDSWSRSWIVWPIAGLLYAAVETTARLIMKKR